MQYSSSERMMQQDAGPSTRPDQPPHSTFDMKSVGILVPPIWPEKPSVWFAQLDGQLALSNFTQDATKFYYAISQLDNKYAAEVEDVITNPLPTCHYDRIKAELIRRLSLSQEQRVRQLLMHEEMGDRRPTQFLRHLRTLTDPPDFLSTLWTNNLPPNTQAIIVTQAQVAQDDVAQLADKIAEVTPSLCVARVSSFCDEISTLIAPIDELDRQVTALSASPSRPRSSTQIRRHARRSSRSAGRSPTLITADTTAIIRSCKEMCHALYVAVGKHGRQSLVATSKCNNSASRLCVMELHTQINFLVDSGAGICVYPRSRLRERRTQTSYELLAANGVVVHTYGCITLHLDLGL
jgi:hypothetical protein